MRGGEGGCYVKRKEKAPVVVWPIALIADIITVTANRGASPTRISPRPIVLMEGTLRLISSSLLPDMMTH